MTALARVHLGRALRALGDRDGARAALEAAAEWHHRAGGGEQAHLGECILTAMVATDGQPGAAARLRKILEAARDHDEPHVEVFALDALAALGVRGDDLPAARRLLDEADRRMRPADHFIAAHDRVDAPHERLIAPASSSGEAIADPAGQDGLRATTPTRRHDMATKQEKSPSELIDERIEELGDWRGETLAHLRRLIKESEPDVEETWKWRGVPVWERDGMICTGESYKDYVKVTFAKGASLDDPAGLFNSSLDGNTRRAIDFRKDEGFDEEAFKTLVRDAVTLNQSKRKR